MNIRRNEVIESGKIFDTATKLINKFFDKLDDFLTDDVKNEVKDHISKSEDGQYNLVIDTNDAMEFELQLSALKELVFDVRISNSGKDSEEGTQLVNISIRYNPNKSNADKLNEYLEDEETGSIFKKLLNDLKSKNSVSATDVEIPKSEKEDDITNYIMSAVSSILESYIGDVWGKITELNKAILNESGTSTAASTKITLQKVLCDTGYDIDLISVDRPTDPTTVSYMLEDLVSNDDFIDSMPVESPIPYEVKYDDDCIDVCECDPYELDICGMYYNILMPLYRLYTDLWYLEWNATGLQRDNISTIVNQFRWTVSDMINEFSRMQKVHCGYALHPTAFLKDYECSFTDSSICYEEVANKLSCYVGDICTILELYYCNFDIADQGYVSSCLRTLKYSNNYFFKD